MPRSRAIFVVSISLPVLAAFAGANARAADANYPPGEGKPHPQIVLPRVDKDAPIALSTYRGKKVLLIYFGSWSSVCRKELPLWYEKTKDLVKAKKLVVLAIAEDQYADRARLLLQWKQIDWPVLFDPLNIMNARSVPLVVGIDEFGFVRLRPAKLETFEEQFVNKKFVEPKVPAVFYTEELTEPKVARRAANEARTALGWRGLGDADVIAGRAPLLNEAIESYQKSTTMQPESAIAWARLGVALRMRDDSDQKKTGDAAAAIQAWEKAISLDSHAAIAGARAKQFATEPGKLATLHKWITTARKQIEARGDTPIVLSPDPMLPEPATQPAAEPVDK